MIKFTHAMIKEAKRLFPDSVLLHDMMRLGDTKALDVVQMKIGFHMDEDDVIRAFRNKKEYRVLDMAKRAKAIRDLYQQMFMLIEKAQSHRAETNGYGDCL